MNHDAAMGEINVVDAAGRPAPIRFTWTYPQDTIAELHVTAHHTGADVTVLLDHHSAVWLMAWLGAFVADSPHTPHFDEIGALDRDGHRHAAAIQLEHRPGPAARMRVTNHTDARTATVQLDRAAAAALMAQLGAFVATT